MMMLSSTEAVSSAKANNIISNLRNLKTAALSWYTDSLDELAAKDIGTNNSGKSTNHSTYWPYVKKYLSSGSSTELDNNYSLVRAPDNKGGKEAWFVIYSNANLELAIKQKLKARAGSVGLLRTPETTSVAYGKTDTGEDNNFGTDKGNWVFMRVK